MTSKRFVGASLSVAVVLSQAACSADRAATPVPEASAKPVTSNPTRASTGTVILPEGTLLAVRTSGALSTNSSETGQTFSATLEQPVLQDGREVALKGARVEGKILDGEKGGRIKGVSGITVQLTGLEIGGQFIYISTNSVTMNASTTQRQDAKIEVGALNFELSSPVTIAAAQVGSKPKR